MLKQKQVYLKGDIKPITVPKFREFSVKAVLDKIRADPEMRGHFPDAEMQVK